MHKFYICYIFLLVAVICCAQKPVEPGKLKQQNITINDDNGIVKAQILTKKMEIKVKPEKVYVWFSQQKLIETKGGYDGKLLHGSYRSFYLNNQLKEQGEMKYGCKNKKWNYWYENGNIRESITWRSGVKNGDYTLYNDLGKLVAKGNFKNDKLDGKFYTYGPDGKVLQKKKYKNGNEKVDTPKTPKIEATKENQKKLLKKRKQEKKNDKKQKKAKKKDAVEKKEQQS